MMNLELKYDRALVFGESITCEIFRRGESCIRPFFEVSKWFGEERANMVWGGKGEYKIRPYGKLSTPEP